MMIEKVCAQDDRVGFKVRVSWWPAIVTGLLLISLMALTNHIVAIDDAFISYRYAENLVRFGQTVFNLDERVEGATNLLWILILAGLRITTHAPMEILSITMSLVLLTFAVARCTMTLQKIGLDIWSSILIVTAVFGLSDVFLSMTTGLEGALYAALLSEALFAFQARRLRLLGILIGLIFMARPEGAVVGAILVIPLLLPFSDWRSALRVVGPAVSIIGATTLWRSVYFTSWIPNSIIDKSFPLNILPEVIATMSIPYIKQFLFSDPSLTIIIIISAFSIASQMYGNQKDKLYLHIHDFSILIEPSLVTIFLSWFIVIRNGGDWMPHFRLLTQYAPCYCVALGLSCHHWPSNFRPALAVLTAIAIWPATKTILSKDCCAINIKTEPPTGIFSEAAQILQTLVVGTDVVSVEAAGFLPYKLLSTKIHDPVGLMDTYIAHHGRPAIPYGKTDISYSFDHIYPSFMIWHWSGHIFEASISARARYTAFCFAQCDQKETASVILVRNDRLDASVLDAFRSWLPWRYLTEKG